MPGILDIKSTVLNTAGIVRDLKIDLLNIKNKNQQSHDNKNSQNSITPNKIRPIIKNKIKTLRQNGICDNVSVDHNKNDFQNFDKNYKINNDSEIILPIVSDVSTTSEASNLTAHQAIIDVNNASYLNVLTTTTGPVNNNYRDGNNSDNDDDGWTLVKHRKIKRNKSESKMNKRITGVKNSPNNKFRSASKTLDLFIGRVHKDVTENDIISYVENNFKVKTVNIDRLNIKAINYAAFKLTINSNDRDTLLLPDKWPSGIIINKY